MPNLEFQLALQADRNKDEHEMQAKYEFYRAQDLEYDLSQLEIKYEKSQAINTILRQSLKCAARDIGLKNELGKSYLKIAEQEE